MSDVPASFSELVILGAGPAYSDQPGSLGSAYLVRTEREAILLDLGQGAFPALAAAFDPAELRAVFISHLHPDHFIDLIPMRHFLRRPEAEAAQRIPLLAPDGLAGLLDAVYATPGFAAAAFEERPLAPGHLSVGAFTLEVRQVRHTEAAFAVRVALGGRGAGLVYTGDVSSAEDVRPLIRPGDLLLSEATFGPGPVPEGMPHLDAPAVGRLGTEAGVSQIVITHVRMGVDLTATMAALRAHYGGPASMARPGSRYLLPAG